MQRTDYARLRGRVEELRGGGLSLKAVADHLNQEGFRPPKRTTVFTSDMVRGLLRRHRANGPDAEREDGAGLLGRDEWWPADLAARLGMSLDTLRRWMRVGWVHARKLSAPRGRWTVWADAEELGRMDRLRACDRSWANQAQRALLSVPKRREAD